MGQLGNCWKGGRRRDRPLPRMSSGPRATIQSQSSRMGQLGSRRTAVVGGIAPCREYRLGQGQRFKANPREWVNWEAAGRAVVGRIAPCRECHLGQGQRFKANPREWVNWEAAGRAVVGGIAPCRECHLGPATIQSQSSRMGQLRSRWKGGRWRDRPLPRMSSGPGNDSKPILANGSIGKLLDGRSLEGSPPAANVIWARQRFKANARMGDGRSLVRRRLSGSDLKAHGRLAALTFTPSGQGPGRDANWSPLTPLKQPPESNPVPRCSGRQNPHSPVSGFRNKLYTFGVYFGGTGGPWHLRTF